MTTEPRLADGPPGELAGPTVDFTPGTDVPQVRLRLRFAKLGRVRFTSHRDVARMWERALRRTRVPVAWSGGFSPRLQVSFGLALPTGCESLGEYLDLRIDANAHEFDQVEDAPPGEECSADTGLDSLAGQLSEALPAGMSVQGIGRVAPSTSSLQQEVTSCIWELEVLGLAADELAVRVGHVLDSPSVVIGRVRKGRHVQDDLRPAIRSLELLERSHDAASSDYCLLLNAELATQPRGVRPAELIEGLGAGTVLARARRTHQWIERDGRKFEPLAMHRTGSPAVAQHAPERAL
jgi:Uncharacterized protein conserved in bacteria (DUF2344)